MARFKVLETCFIRDQIRQPGEEIEFDGQPGEHLEPLDDDAKALVQAMADQAEAKAAAIVAGVAGSVNPEFAAQVASLVDQVATFNATVAALATRLTTVESTQAAPPADLTQFAKASDVADLDAGLSILTGRLDEMNATLSALAAPAAAAPTPTPVTPTPDATQPAPASMPTP